MENTPLTGKDRLAALEQERTKRMANLENAEKKAKEINDKISNEKKRQLDELCRNTGFSFTELVSLVKTISAHGIKIADVTKMIEGDRLC